MVILWQVASPIHLTCRISSGTHDISSQLSKPPFLKRCSVTLLLGGGLPAWICMSRYSKFGTPCEWATWGTHASAHEGKVLGCWFFCPLHPIGVGHACWGRHLGTFFLTPPRLIQWKPTVDSIALGCSIRQRHSGEHAGHLGLRHVALSKEKSGSRLSSKEQ